MMKVTADLLREKQACESQIAIFEAEWPDGVELTLAVIESAQALGLDIDWFATHCLSAQARKAYQKATAPALEAYEKATAPAWEAYQKAKAPALYDAVFADAKAAMEEPK